MKPKVSGLTKLLLLPSQANTPPDPRERPNLQLPSSIAVCQPHLVTYPTDPCIFTNTIGGAAPIAAPVSAVFSSPKRHSSNSRLHGIACTSLNTNTESINRHKVLAPNVLPTSYQVPFSRLLVTPI